MASLAERLLLPSLTIKGLSSGNVGPRARNVIPASATVALGIRLVKGNDPQAMIVSIANHDDNQHAPDENLRIANLWYGIDLYAALLTMP